jgi:hypothetical protein
MHFVTKLDFRFTSKYSEFHICLSVCILGLTDWYMVLKSILWFFYGSCADRCLALWPGDLHHSGNLRFSDRLNSGRVQYMSPSLLTKERERTRPGLQAAGTTLWIPADWPVLQELLARACPSTSERSPIGQRQSWWAVINQTPGVWTSDWPRAGGLWDLIFLTVLSL